MMLGPCSAPSSPPETPVPTKCRPVLAQRLLAAAGVGEVRVAAVDDDVAGLQQRHQLVDHRVGGAAGLDHDDDRARALQRRDEVGRSTRSARTCPRAPYSATRLRVRSGERLCTATGNPCRARLRARLRPITASPVTPICAVACCVIRTRPLTSPCAATVSRACDGRQPPSTQCHRVVACVRQAGGGMAGPGTAGASVRGSATVTACASDALSESRPAAVAAGPRARASASPTPPGRG